MFTAALHVKFAGHLRAYKGGRRNARDGRGSDEWGSNGRSRGSSSG